MEGEILNNLNIQHKLPSFITFISLPDDVSEISYSYLENIKLKKQISPKEIDFLIRYLWNKHREIVKDFSDYQLDLLIISYRILFYLDLESIESKTFVKVLYW